MTWATQAIALQAMGLPLIPLRAEGGGKIPNTRVLKRVYGQPGWAHLRDQHATGNQIETWYAIDPECAAGIITGTPSGLVVVDIDQPDLAPPELLHLNTPKVTTPSGDPDP